MKPFNLITAFLLLSALYYGCELPQYKEKQLEGFCGTAMITDSQLIKAKPRDTLIEASGVFVKYYIQRREYGVIIGNHSWEKDLNNLLPYDAPKSVIPYYEWSSDKIISLKHGCGGNYCSHHSYFVIGTEKVYDRDNVLAFDGKHNLVLQMIGADSVAIENIYTTRKIAYPIKDSLMCAFPMTCFQEAAFKKSAVSIKWQATKNNEDKIVTRTFAIPPQLYKN